MRPERCTTLNDLFSLRDLVAEAIACEARAGVTDLVDRVNGTYSFADLLKAYHSKIERLIFKTIAADQLVHPGRVYEYCGEHFFYNPSTLSLRKVETTPSASVSAIIPAPIEAQPMPMPMPKADR